MAQRVVTLPAGDGLGWVVPALELLPHRTRPATTAALGELDRRYLRDPDDLGADMLTRHVAGIVAGLLAQRELRGSWRD